MDIELERIKSTYFQEEQQKYYMSDSYTLSLLESDSNFCCRIYAQHRPLEFTIEHVHIGSYFRVGDLTEQYRDSFSLWLKTMDKVKTLSISLLRFTVFLYSTSNLCTIRLLVQTMTKVGVVKEIDRWRLMVRLKFYDDDNLTTALYWYPVSTLDAIQHSHQPIRAFNAHLERILNFNQLTELCMFF